MNWKAMIAAVVATSLGGCVTYEQNNATSRRIEQSEKDASDVIAAARATKQPPPRDTVVYAKENWVSPKPIDLRKQNVPEALQCNIAINLEKAPIDILEFSQVITRWCRIPARVTPDALQAIQSQGRLAVPTTTTGQTQASSMPVAGMQIPALPALPQQPTAATGASTYSTYGMNSIGGRTGILDFKYQGDLKPLLDMATQRLGISWKFADGGISFFYIDTRVFNFATIALNTEFASTVQSGMTTTTGVSGSSSGSSGTTGAGGGNSGTQQSANVTMKTSKWDDVSKAINSMLTPNVGRVSISPSSGTITVTDTSEVLFRVERFLDSENKSLTKQVLFNVKVLSVTINNADGLGLDWSLVYKSLSGNYGFALKNVTQVDSSAISATASVLSTATGSAAQFAGTSAVISALAQQGRVSTLRSPSVATLNMSPVPIQIGSSVSYVASAQTTTTAQVGSTTALTPGTVTTGFNMILLPYVLPDNIMLLQSSINISALTRIRSVTSAGTTIEVPEVSSQIFSQAARLRPGETLILSGFEQMAETSAKTGVGTPNNILFGGSLNNSSVRDVIVVLITPLVME